DPDWRAGRRAGPYDGKTPPVDVLARARRRRRARHQWHRHRPVGRVRQGVQPAGIATTGRLLPDTDQTVRLDAVRGATPVAGTAPPGGGAWLQGDQAGLATLRPARPQV